MARMDMLTTTVGDVIVNCCQCQDGVYLNTSHHVQCFNCGHILNAACCTLAAPVKSGRTPMATFDAAKNSSFPDASPSYPDDFSHCTYHNGYHYHK